ncbi:MAG: bifunctional nuclease family protein [Candidatus Omnitrophica bacterium]|nr:bifunctional nuclease family protein [Candidatus Omnitrophota bacterium]
MVPVELSRIIIDEKNHDQAVVLREKGGSRQVPIVIGFVEATSIQMKISGVESPRPLTHDLLVSVLSALGGHVECLTIDDLVDGTFFAKLRLRDKSGHVIGLDCRPSDGIAVAVRLKIPMFIDEKVFTQVISNEL